MAKTQEELNKIKVEYESLNTKLQGLTEEELDEIVGGRRGPSGTWIPVDEVCTFNHGKKCPFESLYRSYQNCPACEHLKDD